LVAYIFQQIAERGKAEGIDNVRQRDSRTWFRDAARSMSSVNKNFMMRDRDNMQNGIDIQDIGRMFMFFYDPKHKDTLPYYDAFPLIFVIGLKDNGFLGMNLHYLPPYLRAKLMDELYKVSSDKKYYKPCVKHYLLEKVQSKFMGVDPEHWDIALMLPSERFKKDTKQNVWKHSIGAVN
jgi:hypothetical protein